MEEEDKAKESLEKQNKTSFLKSLAAGRLAALTQNLNLETFTSPLNLMTVQKFLLDQTPQEQGMEIGYFLTRCPILDSEVIEGDDMTIFYSIAYELAIFDGKNVNIPQNISSYRKNLLEKEKVHDNTVSITNNEILWLRIIDVLEFIRNNPQGENNNGGKNSSESPRLG